MTLVALPFSGTSFVVADPSEGVFVDVSDWFAIVVEAVVSIGVAPGAVV